MNAHEFVEDVRLAWSGAVNAHEFLHSKTFAAHGVKP